VQKTYMSVPRPLYREVKDYLQNLIACGWIEKSKSPYSSPVVCVRKTSAKLNATGYRWVAELSDFNFVIRYRPGRVAAEAELLGEVRSTVQRAQLENPLIGSVLRYKALYCMVDPHDLVFDLNGENGAVNYKEYVKKWQQQMRDNLTKLKRLNLDGNHITKIPPLPPSLEELKMNDNKISGLTPQSFKGLFKLLTLELEGNGFHDGNVSPLAFRPLKKLIYLRLDENKFRAIPSGLPASLQELHMDENHIEEIHEGVLNKTVNLKVLDLSNNRIQENRIAPRAWIHLQQLESIDLSYNRLVHVPSFLPMGLRQLILHHNQIERIPGYVFAHLRPGLEFLHLSHNHLRDDGIHGVSFLGLYRSLTELLLDNNHLRAIPRGLLNLRFLQVLRLNDNHIRYVPLNSICDTRVMEDSPLISIHLENNLIDRRLIPPTAFSCIRSYHSIILRPQSYEE
ncbi:ECM2 protein, partial [Amia calva]|nr:ECM2 protein [Amia calva]